MNAIQGIKKVAAVALAVALLGSMVAPASAQFGFGVYCQTPVGTFGPGVPLPRGSACYVNTWAGTVWGYIV